MNASSDAEDDEWESLGDLAQASNIADVVVSIPSSSFAATENNGNDHNRMDEPLITERLGPDASSSLVLSTARRVQSALPVNSEQSSSNQSRLLVVHEKLDSRRRLKEKLVHHPIRLLWSRFLGYLLSEIWQLDLRVRLALLLILLGFVTKMFLLWTAVLRYPRLFCVPALILVPFFYLNPSYIPVTIERAIHTLQSPSSLVDSLSEFDPTQLRRLCCAALFIPTLLEVRTIQFLSQIQAIESRWATIYQLLVASLIAGAMLTAHTKCHKSARECTHIGLVCLYGAALLVVTVIQFDLWRIPILAAPFFLATGILLLHSVDDNYEWCTQAIRHSLRLSLRDALALVSESVSQDEMLQLAMLRWIVDYWGSTPAEASGAAGEAASRTQSRTPMSRSSVDSTSLVTVPPERELTWSELLPMLALTTEQIRTEVDVLQDRPGSSNSTVQPIPSPAQAASRTSSSSSPGSVTDFQSMLASMDLDEHAKPAVMAYKLAVQSFPPSRETAILLSVARRCPALLALLWELVVVRTASFCSTLILLPFIAFELIRCKRWSESCKRAATRQDHGEEHRSEALFLESVDPSVILLSGDKLSLHRPPTLLGVWMNIVSSVSALEMGLTAARCVQTTAVAIDFGQNIMSLAEFGFQVASRGWIHGAGLLVKELVVHYAHSSQDESRSQTKYTNAALKVLKNSQTMSRNVQVLMEDENSSHVLNSVVGFASVAVGRGWLWGRDETPAAQRTQSSVVIEELDSSYDEPADIIANPPVVTEESGPPNDEPADNVAQASLEESAGVGQEQLAFQTSVPEVMDLIAKATSRGLIHQKEKDELCERLGILQAGSAADDSWLHATKRTLEGLIVIDDSGEEELNDRTCGVEAGGEAASITVAESDTVEPEVSAPRKENDQCSSLVGALQSEPDESSESFAHKLDADSDARTPVKESGHDVLVWQAMGSQMPESAPVADSAIVEETLQSTPVTGENVWMQVGGGLAVVGAVVGMAAIALQGGGRNQQRDDERRRRGNDTLPSQ